MIIFPFIPEKATQKTKSPEFDGMSYVEDETQDTPPKERSKYQPDLYIPAMAFMTYIL